MKHYKLRNSSPHHFSSGNRIFGVFWRYNKSARQVFKALSSVTCCSKRFFNLQQKFAKYEDNKRQYFDSFQLSVPLAALKPNKHSTHAHSRSEERRGVSLKKINFVAGRVACCTESNRNEFLLFCLLYYLRLHTTRIEKIHS